MTDDNPPTIRPRKSAAARAGIAVVALAIVGGGIAIGLSVGGSPSPVRTSEASAHTHKGAATSTTTTTVPSTTSTVAPQTTTGTGPEKSGAPSASTTTTTTTTPTTTTPTSTKSTTPDKPTPTVTAAAGGNCTNPSFSSSNAEATDNTDPNDGYQYWWVNNDAWSGGHGPQTINVCNQSSWYAVSDQPNVGGQVETYPSTEYDIGGRADTPLSVGSTTPISGLSSITSTFSEAYPSAGGWDAAYDLWTNDWKNETMIWNQWAGSNDYWPGKATIAVTLGGVGYTFYANCNGPADAANETNCEYMFFRDTQVTSGSVDILAAWQWEVANGYASASDVPTQMEYGVEISYTSGTETFPMTGLTFNAS